VVTRSGGGCGDEGTNSPAGSISRGTRPSDSLLEEDTTSPDVEAVMLTGSTTGATAIVLVDKVKAALEVEDSMRVGLDAEPGVADADDTICAFRAETIENAVETAAAEPVAAAECKCSESVEEDGDTLPVSDTMASSIIDDTFDEEDAPLCDPLGGCLLMMLTSKRGKDVTTKNCCWSDPSSLNQLAVSRT